MWGVRGGQGGGCGAASRLGGACRRRAGLGAITHLERGGVRGAGPGATSRVEGTGRREAAPLRPVSIPARGPALATGLRACERQQLVQPAGGYYDVVIQRNQEFAPSLPQSLVDRCWEPNVGRVRDDCDRYRRRVLHAREVVAGSIGRAVVNDDQLPTGASAAHQGGNALSGEFKLVPAGNDDRGELRTDVGRVIHVIRGSVLS